MKVLICHNYYIHTSGEDLVIRTDIETLRAGDHDVIEYKRMNVETQSYTFAQKVSFFPNTIYSLHTVREVEAIVQSEHPDVAIVQNVFPLISPSIYYVLHRLRVPIVQLVYNYRFICPNAILFTRGHICERCIKGDFFHAARLKCYRDSYLLSGLYATTLAMHRHVGDVRRLISAYVTPDDFLKRKLVEGGFPSERTFPIITPFDSSLYEPSYDHSSWLIYFGRIVREKGIFTLLEAMRRLPNHKLLVVGWGEALEEANKFVQNAQMANVQFKAPVYGEELSAMIRTASAIVVPTEWYDNSPVVLLHAMSLGKPVIVSNIDGIPEIVEHGQTGLLFEPGNVEDLTEKIRLLTGNEVLRLQIAHNARRQAQTMFTAEQRFNKLIEVIRFAQTHTV